MASATLVFMKRIYNKDNRLESHRLFPYFAWVTIIGFALFVFNLVHDVEKRISALEAQSRAVNTTYGVTVETPQIPISE